MSANVVLEDDEQRALFFNQSVSELLDDSTLKICQSVSQFFDHNENSEGIDLISLDYDLSFSPAKDPGRGSDVADFLSSKKPRCPVILHTSDMMGRDAMSYRLESSGWDVTIVEPQGPPDMWVSSMWIQVVKKLLENSR